MSEVTLYKVMINAENEATIQSETFRETEKSYIPINKRASWFISSYARLPKDYLHRHLIGRSAQEAVKLAYDYYMEKVGNAQDNLQKAEAKLNAIEMM